MSANPHRGEVALSLDGRPRILRPTFGAMVALENAMGTSIPELAQAVFQNGTVKISADQARHIVGACLVDGDGAALDGMAPDGGFAAVATAFSQLLVAMIAGGAAAQEPADTGELAGEG